MAMGVPMSTPVATAITIRSAVIIITITATIITATIITTTNISTSVMPLDTVIITT